ncbi:DUF3080 family protein [Vibrio lentus]|nr:DUF3080 family protein [Vibrio lentus]
MRSYAVLQMRGSQSLHLARYRRTSSGRPGGALEHINLSVKNTPLVSGKTTAVQERLEKSSTLGDLYYSLSMKNNLNDTITQQLTTYWRQHHLWRATERLNFAISTMFEQQYIDKVQPYMAQLDGATISS